MNQELGISLFITLSKQKKNYVNNNKWKYFIRHKSFYGYFLNENVN